MEPNRDDSKNPSKDGEKRPKGNLLMMFSVLLDKVKISAPTKEQAFSKSVLDYMEQHFSENITSKEIADIFSYDHSYFCRKFKGLFSQNFSDFLNGYRVSKAKEMLKTQSVTQSATDCGFQNIQHSTQISFLHSSSLTYQM